ncbi:hypothetical protein ATCV1_z026L [Acanthocystis turfacea chlorella virus 1]|uniref:Uncharacterized protein z026L n=1 Tax=Chlorovirus heliozoae TaxID=322019 RepID=A7K7Y6_9PHYC|nr:hypothetical protein ATCV1_z026L [Acanthocystis turfacea chlorella virus 1]ABT16160.1 hypothetical protein ATCV1_z026L [Acanthocystis turfacea chlorella virus 1]
MRPPGQYLERIYLHIEEHRKVLWFYPEAIGSIRCESIWPVVFKIPTPHTHSSEVLKVPPKGHRGQDYRQSDSNIT